MHPDDGKGDEIRLPVNAGKPLSAKVATGKAWDLDVEIPGYWAPEWILNVPASPGVLERRIDLVPTGRLSGSLKMLDPKLSYPRDFGVIVQSPPATPPAQKIPQSRIPCSVDRRGAWMCEVPSGVVDLQFRAKGFVPHYQWGRNIPTKETLNLGKLELRRGASLRGWVEVEGGSILPGQCIARLAPLQAPGVAQPKTEDRLRRAVLQQTVGKDGFFQLEGIAPGTYRLEVQQPGYAPAQAFPLDVWNLSETSLKQHLVLKRPLTLELAFSPPVDWLGHPWQVFVQKRSDFSAGVENKPAFQGAADRQGNLRIPDQSPGDYLVQVSDSLGNPFLHEAALTFDVEDSKRNLDVPIQDIRGRVTLGADALPATLWFGGQHGTLHVKMECDTEGKYQGVLPHGGSWTVQVLASDPKIDTHLKAEVKADSNKVAVVDLTVPDTRISGHVVDEAGHGVAGAEVILHDLLGITSTEAEEEGKFELRGISEGRAELSAQAHSPEGKLTSDPQVLAVTEGDPVGPLTLVLHRTKELQGIVQSPRGPVPGASIRISSLRPVSANADQARSGIDGSFTFRVDARTEAVVAVVSPPGMALQVFSVPIGSEPIALTVSEEEGDLDVTLPFNLRDSTDQLVLVFQNGLPLSIPTLLVWTEGHGQKFDSASGFHASSLAPGEYVVCIGAPTISTTAATPESSRQNGQCVSGTLASGANLRLSFTKD
ncbi:MAG TPA: carboxypeptidase-like regulatory domain-containing protein [Thermoanaerobaculia bacterium]|nr:carboxypeptidase-like regulatory domain-containing protein [Thermoanaerobaculia bacterium]